MSPAHIRYEGNAKVRVLAPGVSGEEIRRFNPGRPMEKPRHGYEMVKDTARRTGISEAVLYHKLRWGKIPGAVRNGKFWFVPKGWTP